MASLAEREAILNYDEESNKWSCYTSSPKIHTKIKKILEEGQLPTKVYKDEEGKEIAWQYELGYKQIRFASVPKKMEMSDEKRQELRERMLKIVEAQKQKKENVNE